ncbi:DUF922 domain-containing Zn-dependent protease [Arvimicrobium flavum]|uniref:DUF922 domain-containing Zn-dependent protease n=1 Tax=Arvimicrobium flavum TaxID=3393320 RepID=UPI00237A0BB2|nr:DUF922 domain-containing protein [Mesorhizobium shangrilense]
MMRTACAALLLLGATGHSDAAELSKTYSYFSIRGNTLDEIEAELSRRGPNVNTTGQRHPGATRMEFKTRLTYADTGKRCEITSAKVRVTAKVILPRWRAGRKASAETRFVWDTLASDIKRHEEAHVVIARNYGRKLEEALSGIGRQRTCEQASAKATKVTDRILGRHDAEQQRFDRVESAGFEKRLLRLLEKRMKARQQG